MTETDQEKSSFLNACRAQMMEWEAKIESLREKARETSGTLKMSAEEGLNELDERRKVAATKLEELRGSSGEAWKDMKVGMDAAWRSLDDAFKRAMEQFR